MTQRNEARDALVAQVLKMLDSGVIPWRKPWSEGTGTPVNAVTGKPYRGMNRILLAWSDKGRYWAGYGQWRKIGAQVRSGERATVIWAPTRWLTVTDKPTGKTVRIPIGFKAVNVFSASQVSGWTAPKVETRDVPPIERAEAIVANMPNAPTVRYTSDGDLACYSPVFDCVQVPTRDRFVSAEAFYCTLFHELSHSTGHESRCKREGIGNMERHEYSREELVAEFGALFTCGEVGIAPVVVENSAAYIKTWRDRIANAPDLMDAVVTDAEKASDYILGKAKTSADATSDAA